MFWARHGGSTKWTGQRHAPIFPRALCARIEIDNYLFCPGPVEKWRRGSIRVIKRTDSRSPIKPYTTICFVREYKVRIRTPAKYGSEIGLRPLLSTYSATISKKSTTESRCKKSARRPPPKRNVAKVGRMPARFFRFWRAVDGFHATRNQEHSRVSAPWRSLTYLITYLLTMAVMDGVITCTSRRPVAVRVGPDRGVFYIELFYLRLGLR